MKRTISTIMIMILSCQLFTITAFARPEWPSDTGILAEGGIVIDVDSGTMIYGQNIRKAYPPASITKLLTALVVLERGNLEDQVIFSSDAINNVESGSGNSLKLAVGDKLSVRECLYALLIKSSNQSANALAEHIGGSREGFVDMMNEKVKELGGNGSRFKNPSGLNDPEQLVTPYDMALIAKAAFANEELLKISSARKHTFPPTIENPEGITVSLDNKILSATDSSSKFYFPDAVAGKTGYTSLAGNTLVTYAQRDGRRLIAVILKGKKDQYYLDTIALLKFGFEKFQNLDVAEQELTDTTGTEAVTIGGQTYAPSDLVIESPSFITLPKTAAFSDVEQTLDTDLSREQKEGAVAVIRYTYNERNIGQAYLSVKAQAQQEGGQEDQSKEVEATSQPATMPETGAPGDGENISGKPSGFVKILSGAGMTLVAIILIGAGYLYYERRQEVKRRALRKERRRHRLLEDGFTEEEFQRMMEKKRKKR